jgi:HPt (histidine-containing phosphotransfer) domain-containing protein
MTAHAISGDREQCLAAGMDDYLSKPYSREQLDNVVGRWVRSTPNSVRPIPCPAPPLPVTSRFTGDPAASCERIDNAPDRETAEQPHAAGIDTHAWAKIQALQRDDRPDLLVKIMTLYLAESRGLVEAIRRAIERGDAGELHQAAHALKSSSANLGAVHLSEQCRALEQAGQDRALGQAEGVFAALQAEYASIREAFLAEVRKRQPS